MQKDSYQSCDYKKLTVIQFKYNGTQIPPIEDVKKIVEKYKTSLITKQPLLYHQPFEIKTINFMKDDIIVMSPRYPNQVPEGVAEQLCNVMKEAIEKEEEPIVVTAYEFDFSILGVSEVSTTHE